MVRASRLILLISCIIAINITSAISQESTDSKSDSKEIDLSKIEKEKEQVSFDNLFNADFENKTTYIKANSLTLKTKERLFIYTGNVELKQGDMIMTAGELQGTYSGANRLESITASGNVVITKGETIRATGEKAFYDSKAQTVTLTDNPELNQEGNILSADRIIVYLNEDRSVAEGMVRVKVSQTGEKGNSLESLAKE